NRSGFHFVVRTKTIHINSSKLFQFLTKLRQQFGVKFRIEVSQSISECKFYFFTGKNVFTFWRVIDLRFKRFWLCKFSGNSLLYLLLKGHCYFTLFESFKDFQFRKYNPKKSV